MQRLLFKVQSVRTRGSRDMYPMASLTITSDDGSDDLEWTLARYVFYYDTKEGCNHYDDVKRFEICLKTLFLAIAASSFIIEPITEGIPVCDAVSRIAKAIFSKLKIHDVVNIVQLFMHSFLKNFRKRENDSSEF